MSLGRETPPGRPASFLARSLLVLSLLCLYWFLAVGGVLHKSAAFDEVAHLTAGYSYWRTGDFRLSPGTGNLPQRWAGLALLGEPLGFPSLHQEAWWKSALFPLGRQFFYECGNDADALLLRGRMMMATLAAVAALLVFLCSRKLFGYWGGVLSLTLVALCPTMLAHGALVTADLPASLFFLASVWWFWTALHHATPLNVLGSSVALAGLLLTKVSGVLVLPMFGIMLTLRLIDGRAILVKVGGAQWVGGRRRLLLRCGAVLLVQVAVVWALVWVAYDCRFTPFAEAQEGRDTLGPPWPELLARSGRMGAVIDFAREHRLLPEAYLYSFASMNAMMENTTTRSAFLDGKFSVRGWRSFFPYAFLVKTPLPLFLSVGLAAWAVVSRWRVGRGGGQSLSWAAVYRTVYASAPLWILFVTYWAAAIRSNLNIGHRHILPTYLVLYVFAGAAAWLFKGAASEALDLFPPHDPATAEPCRPADPAPLVSRPPPLLPRVLLVLALAWLAVESYRIWPDDLAYFNQLAGGPAHGYRRLVDSSLDWGQDLPGLKKWLDDRGLDSDSEQPVYLSYFGSARPEYYGIRAEVLPSFFERVPPRVPPPLRPGVYCVSATMLQGVYLRCKGRWTEAYENEYVEGSQRLKEFVEASPNAEARAKLLAQFGEQGWADLFRTFEHLRFRRLCCVLLAREPDAQVGHSILIYGVSPQELEEGLRGPPPLETKIR